MISEEAHNAALENDCDTCITERSEDKQHEDCVFDVLVDLVSRLRRPVTSNARRRHSVNKLPQPIGRQREVLCLPPSGHQVVLGTAGSGKTTLAILRSLYLANPTTDHHGKTLLVTFSRCLVSYLESLASFNASNIDVRNYHRFARGYLASRGKMRNFSIADPDVSLNLCKQVLEIARADNPNEALLQKPAELFREEFAWFAKNGITDLNAYLAAKRLGRSGFRVPSSSRGLVFGLYRKYIAARSSANKDYDWEDLALTVCHELLNDSTNRMYKHVVIDEGQDLSPMEIKSLAACIPADGSLTFFGDIAQQIYGRRFSWRSAGLHISEVWRFQENYRNTQSIAALALALARTAAFKADADIVSPKSPSADGPKPLLLNFTSDEREKKVIASLAGNLAKSGTVAVLFTSREQEKDFASWSGIPSTRLHRDLNRWPSGNGVFRGTFHSAKGLEFDSVIIPFVSASNFPPPADVELFGVEEAMTDHARLLYVGITRARTQLVLSYSGTPSSLLPPDPSLYDRKSP